MSKTTVAGQDSAPCGSGNTTPSAHAQPQLAAGFDEPGEPSTGKPRASPMETCSCARRRWPTGPLTSTEQASSLRAALELARRLRSTDLEAEALQAHGRILIDQGHVDEGMAHLDEAMLFAVEGRLGPFSTGKVYCSLIAACEEVGDFDRAAEWTDATLRWAQQHPFAIFPGICRLHRAIVLKRRGELGAAEEEAARACEELRESHVANSAAAWAEVGDIRRRLGQIDQAEGAFARSQAVSGSPCGGLALLRLAQGRVKDAMTIITSCIAQQSNPLGRSGLLTMLVQIAVGAGDLDAAHRALSELEETVATFGTASLCATEQSTARPVDVGRW